MEVRVIVSIQAENPAISGVFCRARLTGFEPMTFGFVGMLPG